MELRVLLVTIAVLAAPSTAQIDLAPMFARHMVLQRDTEAPIFGRASPGAPVEVRADWPGAEPARGVADVDGRFRIDVRTPAAGGPFTVLVASGNAVVRLDDLLIGEVWLCSGQSNMEWSVARSGNAEAEIAAADHPRIRLLTVPNTASAAPRDTFDASWVECAPGSVRDFSAVGYSFGRALQRELGGDVPIGLISADWGGTPAESWTPRDGLEPFPEFATALVALRELATDPATVAARHARAQTEWERAVIARDVGFPAPGRPVGFAVPCYDDSGWDELAVPGKWTGTAFADFDGVLWYRRAVAVPVEWAGQDLVLELGQIDDDERTYFQGVEVGGTRGWDTPRSYLVPGRGVRGGRTVVAVRAHDTGGEGGFTGADGIPRLYPVGRADAAISLAGAWKVRRGVAQSELPPSPSSLRVGSHTPSALYNGMIAPLTPFALRGAIWYQGESNVGRAEQYQRLFPAMITHWRRAWGHGEFPFLFVQIAPYRYGNRDPEAPAELRDAQRKTLELVPGTGMVVTMDIGDPGNIHPADKVTVGERLALWALATSYGKDVECSGPLFDDVVAGDDGGDSLRVSFTHAVGLTTRDGAAPSHFEVAGEDGVFRAATARIDGDSVVVRAVGVATPVQVRYGWGEADQPNLCNAAGLPASSFRARIELD